VCVCVCVCECVSWWVSVVCSGLYNPVKHFEFFNLACILRVYNLVRVSKNTLHVCPELTACRSFSENWCGPVCKEYVHVQRADISK
jgi:hypothetical protein